MPLYWIVHRVNDKPVVRMEEANAMVYARLKAAFAGFTGEFTGAYALDEKTARKVPERLVGRALRQGEAGKLLKRIG